MRPPTALVLVVAVAAAIATFSSTAAAPAVHLTEQHYRSNAQRSGELVFPSGGRHSSAEPLIARCATGRLGAPERWSILLLHDGVEQLRRSLANAHLATVVFFNAERNLRVRSPPCTTALAKLRDHVARQHHARDTVRVERLDADSGGFVVVTYAPAAPRVVVAHGESVAIAHKDADADADSERLARERAETQTRLAAAVNASAFASVLDALAGVAALREKPQLTAERRQSYATEFASAGAAARTPAYFAEQQREHLELLLQEERELLLPVAPDAVEASWSPVFSLDRWAKLRQRTDPAGRRALAERWAALARLWLASSGDVPASVQCLRRAVQWSPGFAPAYLELSSLLVHHAGNASASCAAMELMLAGLDTDEPLWSARELSGVLTTHFPHCSVVIRVAHLWETSAVFRAVAVMSAVLSVAHGVSVLLSVCHDQLPLDAFYCCSRWRRAAAASTSSPAPAPATGGGGRSRRLKRE
ncbi:hypothetical protein PybrP1_010070 [[Pythium] brassicae (nom. inval.)]|nr:hypothetical protein PybrP1_010070 [[Pythium] brassicae (nom. inval.)]